MCHTIIILIYYYFWTLRRIDSFTFSSRDSNKNCAISFACSSSSLKYFIKDDAKLVGEGDVGFVDQKYTLFRHKTITQICNYALRKKGITKDEKSKLIFLITII